MSEKILVVNDEVEIADLIEVYLKNENYTVFKFYTAAEALKCIHTTMLDLAILDIMLPDINGFTLCQKIRERYTYPVIMLTAKDAETDKITGLTLGADDYITKPFRPLEMVARAKSQLRRYKKYNTGISEEKQNIILYTDLSLDIKKHECMLNDRPIALTPTEFSILQILLENKGDVISGEVFLIYHNNFRGYQEIFFMSAIIIIFLLLLLFLFRWITRYFKEINRGIDSLLEDDGNKIFLSREILLFACKLNTVKQERLLCISPMTFALHLHQSLAI